MTTIDQLCNAAARASLCIGESERPHHARAAAMDAIAAALDSRQADLVALASDETALTPAELNPEFARMTGQIRQYAQCCRDESWRRPAIEPRLDRGAVGPGHDVRRVLVPLGEVVAVFGASNFPFAYGVLGGDTASALAAGCGVVVKEHPAHPRTGAAIVRVAADALSAAGCPPALVGYAPNPDPRDLTVAAALVGHPLVAAVGFTGSFAGGMAIDALARRGPIPAFCEMGSVNPVLVTAATARARGEAVAEALADAMLMRFGQQCTRPGLIVVEDGERVGESLRAALAARVAAAPGRDMLAPWVRDGYVRRAGEIEATPGVRVLARGPDKPASGGTGGLANRAGAARLFGCNAGDVATRPTLREEIFGPACIVVDAPALDGHAPDTAPYFPAGVRSLTWSIFCEPSEVSDRRVRGLFDRAARCAGRVVVNGVPTGVRVAPAMVHGGPFPATNRPDSSAVGATAIERWCRPVCFQNCPDDLLPRVLRDAARDR